MFQEVWQRSKLKARTATHVCQWSRRTHKPQELNHSLALQNETLQHRLTRHLVVLTTGEASARKGDIQTSARI